MQHLQLHLLSQTKTKWVELKKINKARLLDWNTKVSALSCAFLKSFTLVYKIENLPEGGKKKLV